MWWNAAAVVMSMAALILSGINLFLWDRHHHSPPPPPPPPPTTAAPEMVDVGVQAEEGELSATPNRREDRPRQRFRHAETFLRIGRQLSQSAGQQM